jgi:hypothetical protein
MRKIWSRRIKEEIILRTTKMVMRENNRVNRMEEIRIKKRR